MMGRSAGCRFPGVRSAGLQGRPRPMIDQGSGSIVNMSSTRSVAGAADLVAFGTSKAGVQNRTVRGPS